jgi:AcrR family transcriptional regulator
MSLADQVERDRSHDVRAPLQRQRLLESARSIFLEKGHAGGSIDDIVALAGVSKAAVYNSFQNKDDLFETLIKSEARRIAQELPTVDLKGPDPTLSLQNLAAAIIRQFSEPATLAILRLVIGSLGRFPSLGEEFLRRSLGPSRFQAAAYFDMKKTAQNENSFALAERFTNDCLAQSLPQLFVIDQMATSEAQIAMTAQGVLQRLEERD